MAEKNVTVKVILDPPGSNPPFHFESTDLPMINNVIYFSNCGKSKGFFIDYTIVDTANPGYRFPTSVNGNDYLDHALWVTETGPCPMTACKWDAVFKAVRVKDSGKTLVVWNKNAVVQTFFYTLRVVKGTDWLELDPGGTNQNGGLPFYTDYSVGILTGAIVGLGTLATAVSSFDVSAGLTYAIGGAVVGLIIGFLLNRT